jgi:hypothetical protein
MAKAISRRMGLMWKQFKTDPFLACGPTSKSHSGRLPPPQQWVAKPLT